MPPPAQFPAGTLLDVHGRPMAQTRFYQGGDRFRNGDQSEMYYQDAAVDTDELLDTGTWLDMMTASRFLFANEPLVRGAVLEQAALSFPLVHQYKGKDKKWGNRVGEPWLAEWKRNKTVRGPAFTNEICARLRLIARKVDGDCASILTYEGNQKFPKVQYVRAHRVGDRTISAGTLKSGPYAGKRITNGVILSKLGAPLAYNVLGDTPDEDRLLKAGSMFLTYNPDAFDESRGKSELLTSIAAFADIKRLRTYEMRAQHMFASICLLEDSESGTASDTALSALTRPAAGVDTAGSAAGLVTKRYEKGMHLFFKAQSGAGLKAFRGDRPSRDSQTWEDKMVEAAIYGTGWDPNFALMLKQPGGALARIMVEKIRRTIMQNQEIEARAQRMEDAYALAGAIALGLLDPPSDNDVTSWEYQGPPRLSADSGNEAKARLEAYKAGLGTLQCYIAESGGDWENHREQKSIEAEDLAEHARYLTVKFPEMNFREWMNFLEQRNINPGSPDADDPGDEAPGKPPGGSAGASDD